MFIGFVAHTMLFKFSSKMNHFDHFSFPIFIAMQSSAGSILFAVLYIFSLLSSATATNFTFSYTEPTQCGNLSISWSGTSKVCCSVKKV